MILREMTLAAFFLAAASADLRVRKVPNRLLLAALLARFLLWMAELCLTGPQETGLCLLNSLLGSLFLTVLLFSAACFSGGRFGMGDVKFAGTAALYAGFWRMLFILLWGLLAAAAFSLLQAAFAGKSRRAAYPLVPFLAAGFLLECIFRFQP